MKDIRNIIDTHLHIWDLQRFSLPWLDSVEALNRTYRVEDYLREGGQGEGWRIEKAVYVEVDVAPAQRMEEADYIAGVCADEKSIIDAAVISVDMASGQAAEHLRPFRGHAGIRGVRHVLHVDSSPKGACLKETFVNNVRFLGEQGMLFEGCLRCPELADFVRLAELCPDTLMVLDHMGNVDPALIANRAPDTRGAEARDQWKKDIDALGKLPNVACKISGLNAFGDWDNSVLEPALEHCFAAFGEDRILFASNYPVCELSLRARPWMEALMEITAGRSKEFNNKLFHDNASRIYRM
jgi:predicted TIM-barrel fold metal-dependent hydrolase